MADTDVWALGAISSPAATDRVPIATGSGAGGYSERSEFIWLSDSYYWADGKMRVGGPAGVGFINFSSTAVNDIGAVGCGVTTGYGDSVGIAVQNATGVLTLATNSTERMRIGASGNVGIGTNAPGVRLHVVGDSGQIALFGNNNVRGTGNGFLGIADATGRKAYIGYGGPDDTFYVANEINDKIVISTNGINRWMYEAGGNFRPYNDNGYSVGVAANRISVLYAGTGTINTSDERVKVWIGRATEDRAAKDRRIARAILDELGWYQFTDAVTEKGPDGARWHFGARAQRIWQIVADEGLAPPLVDVEGILLPDITWTGPVAPAWLCFDGWNDQFEDVYRDVVHVDEVQVGEEGTGEFGPDGAEIMRPVIEEIERIEREPTGERQLVREAGHLFGFRVDEMNLLLSWALHDRLSALEEITAGWPA